MDYAITLQTADGRIASTELSYDSLIRTADYTVIRGAETLQIAGAKVRSTRGVSFERDERSTDARAVTAQDSPFVAALKGGPEHADEGRLILPTLRLQGVVTRSGKPVD